MSKLEITEVRVKLNRETDDRLIGYCSITLSDAIVIKDIKIISGDNGPFVAMPSRKINSRCQACGSKNHIRAQFCNECGGKLPVNRSGNDARGRERLHFDIVHPISANVRVDVHDAIMDVVNQELERRKESSY